MKITDFIDIYNLIDSIVNEGATISDFGISDETREIWATLSNGKEYCFILEEKTTK